MQANKLNNQSRGKTSSPSHASFIHSSPHPTTSERTFAHSLASSKETNNRTCENWISTALQETAEANFQITKDTRELALLHLEHSSENSSRTATYGIKTSVLWNSPSTHPFAHASHSSTDDIAVKMLQRLANNTLE